MYLTSVLTNPQNSQGVCAGMCSRHELCVCFSRPSIAAKRGWRLLVPRPPTPPFFSPSLPPSSHLWQAWFSVRQSTPAFSRYDLIKQCSVNVMNSQHLWLIWPYLPCLQGDGDRKREGDGGRVVYYGVDSIEHQRCVWFSQSCHTVCLFPIVVSEETGCPLNCLVRSPSTY